MANKLGSQRVHFHNRYLMKEIYEASGVSINTIRNVAVQLTKATKLEWPLSGPFRAVRYNERLMLCTIQPCKTHLDRMRRVEGIEVVDLEGDCVLFFLRVDPRLRAEIGI